MLIKAKDVPMGAAFVTKDKKYVCVRVLTPDYKEISKESTFGDCIACFKEDNNYYHWILAEDEVFCEVKK